ncbi:MAG: hypothetical protein KAU91_05580, partial [Candidatus Aminicenantes bacterium]|nr:hypothetical protein [Candidatus Aminicenantes bacterium]
VLRRFREERLCLREYLGLQGHLLRIILPETPIRLPNIVLRKNMSANIHHPRREGSVVLAPQAKQ